MENFTGGNLTRFVGAWDSLTGDAWVLQVVQRVHIPFQCIPVQECPPFPYRLSGEDQVAMDQEIDKLLGKGVIERVALLEGQFISNVFLRPKGSFFFRLILDLTEFNKCIVYEHFKMTCLQTALDMLREGSWIGSVDLRDAYDSVAVADEDRRFLRFLWRGVLYQFVGMPNGLACAQRIFTKLLAPVFATLRKRGHECFPYIDDSFIIGDSREQCRVATWALCTLLDNLGFVVHLDRSVLEPTQNILFLGFRRDSVGLKVALTEDKRDKLLRAAEQVLQKDFMSIREVAGWIGLMVAYSLAVEYGGAHIKLLEWDKNMALESHKGNFEGRMQISERAKCDVVWWAQAALQGQRKIRLLSPDIDIYTDASMEGWGARRRELALGGRWMAHEVAHINVLELRAIFLGLKKLCPGKGTHMRVWTDNTTALAYVKNMGGVKSEQCNEVAREIWCEENDVWLTLAHVLGVANYKSRNFSDGVEWELNDRIFQKVCKIFGKPHVDLFAIN